MYQLASASTYCDVWNCAPGDVVWHDASDTWFFISSLAAATSQITMFAMNGFLDTAGTITWPNGAPDVSQGNYTFYSGRFYVPQTAFFGDVAKGSDIISRCGRGDGNTLGFADIVEDDWLSCDRDAERPVDWSTSPPSSVDGPLFPVGTFIDTKDPVARTIKMSAVANGTQPARILIFRDHSVPNDPTPA